MNNALNHIIQGLDQSFLDPERLMVSAASIFIVCIVGLLTGPRPANANSFLWIILSATIGSIGDRLDKINRSRADLLFRGFLVTIFTVVLVVMLGRIIDVLAAASPYKDPIEILVLCLGLSAGSLWNSLIVFYKAKENKGKESGIYLPISKTARVDLNTTDDYGVARVAMSILPRMLDNNIIAPLFWYIIGGLPLFFLSLSISFLSNYFGKQGFTKGFGLFPLWLDTLMGYIPHIITALILTMAAILTPTASTWRTAKSWLSRKADVPYAQGGMPLKIFSYALNISVGGPIKDSRGSALQNLWTGPEGATAKTGHQHLKRALYMSIVAHIITIAIFTLLYVYIGHNAI